MPSKTLGCSYDSQCEGCNRERGEQAEYPPRVGELLDAPCEEVLYGGGNSAARLQSRPYPSFASVMPVECTHNAILGGEGRQKDDDMDRRGSASAPTKSGVALTGHSVVIR